MNPYPGLNSILVMDNAGIHRGGDVARLCHDAGVRVIYLPPYCPELNPIELCFSQVKINLRRTQALVHSLDPEWVIERTCYRVVTPSLLHKLYAHAGYDCSGAAPPRVSAGTLFPK
jgi:transposase